MYYHTPWELQNNESYFVILINMLGILFEDINHCIL